MKEFRKREYLSICKLLKIEAIRELARIPFLCENIVSIVCHLI